MTSEENAIEQLERDSRWFEQHCGPAAVRRKEAVRNASNIQGWMSIVELEWLYDRASEMESVVEIGCWKGRSTSVLAAACKGTVYAVDHFKGSASEIKSSHAEINDRPGLVEKEFFENIVAKFDNVAVLPFSSETVAKGTTWIRDMVFIDADHSYDSVKTDIEMWRPKTRKLLCGHDRGQDGVPQALKDCGVEFKNGPGTIWYVEVQQ